MHVQLYAYIYNNNNLDIYSFIHLLSLLLYAHIQCINIYNYNYVYICKLFAVCRFSMILFFFRVFTGSWVNVLDHLVFMGNRNLPGAQGMVDYCFGQLFMVFIQFNGGKTIPLMVVNSD